ncbi:MAG: hypothetical protein JRF33_23805 [Deltaproteobacteria bacterium]|nr:hypothetical protein [Deltaproteobacteria bacterium]
MRSKLFWILSVLFLPASLSAQGLKADDIAGINAAIEEAGLSWRAAENPITRLSDAERWRLILPAGKLPPWADREDVYSPKGEVVLRDRLLGAIDWRDHMGYDWDSGIRDQGDCGSCWAFATIANIELLMNWRLSEPSDRDLSEQQLLSCSNSSMGCDSGGITWLTTGSFLTGTGAATESCYPYTSGTTGEQGDCVEVSNLSPECQQAVVKMEDLIEIEETSPGSIWEWLDPPEYFMSVEASDIVKGYLEDRPVGASFRVFSDFYAYDTGIYEPSANVTDEGLHAVQIVGFNDAEAYWIVKNSWGPAWGEDGYFRIRYGSSSFGMFSFVYEFREDHAQPVYCGDLPASVTLDVSEGDPVVEFMLRNCGGGALEWQATPSDNWIRVEDISGQPAWGAYEVAVGRTYRIKVASTAVGGLNGSIAFNFPGASGGPTSIQVLTEGSRPEPEPEPAQDAGGGEDAGTAGDAGTEDAGGVEDGGLTTEQKYLTTDGGGCSCSGGPVDGPFGLLVLLFGLMLLRRRGTI